MLWTTWVVLFKPYAADACNFIVRVNQRFDSTDDPLSTAVDAILKEEMVVECIRDLESWSIAIHELPELPEVATPNQLKKAYEGRITDAYLDDCPVMKPGFSAGQVGKPHNLALIIYHVSSETQHIPSSTRLSPVQDHYDQQALRNKIASTGKRRKAPSTEGTVERLRETQKPIVPAAIHNGRPLNLTGMPPSIYHPAFTTFLRVMHETEKFTREELRTARSCVEAFAAFYGSESERTNDLKLGGLQEAAHPSNDFLTQIKYNLKSGAVLPDGSLRAIVPGQVLRPPFCIVEVQAEVGKGACDPMAQAEQCYKAIYCSDEARPYYEVSCCPCLLVGIAGPNIWISGAIIGDYILAQPLADISFVPKFTIGPHFTTFKTKDDTKVMLKYTGRLSPEECRKAVFTALAYTDPATTQPTAVVVKFTHTYSATAHALLAEHAGEPFAPKLWFCEKVASVGMYVVVMDHLQDAQDAADRKMTATQYASLKKAITLLHGHDLAFGDLREPNVLLSGDGVMLIDFDWCGKEGEVFYPYDINMEAAIGWHPEVFPCELIKKEHDMHMLAALGDVGEENGN
ncbi:hypothetical protein C2E23DRAFT_907962 [Lenzites betulinus]|nr:hypothetical protein C2E23DRAFT_907962 [Lenzites betulinus]